MLQSPRPPPPPPPPGTAPPRSKKRHPACPKSNRGAEDISVSNCLPQKDKRTRNLPNLSDCHGCGLRINYSNPKERLHPLESVWRIVLLCKKCKKMVNSGKLCPYCLKDTVNFVSDCVRCSDCERYIHKDCVVKYSNSPPWSYSCNELGLGFSVCIDCWVPKLLKNSVRTRMRKETTEKYVGELCASKGDYCGLRMGKDGIISLEEVVKDANSVVEKKIAVAVKAKEKALRKAVVAKNALLLASNALNLVAKKDCNSKNSEGLVTSTSDGSSANELRKSVDDAELAFQLHRAINSSPRISRSACSMNVSCSDLLGVMDSMIISAKSNDLGSGEGGKVAVCSNPVTDGNRSNILEATACLMTIGSGSAIRRPILKRELMTYKRNNKKRKECQENAENGYDGMFFGGAENSNAGDGSITVTETQSSELDKLKQALNVNDARTSGPHSCKTEVFTEKRSVNRRSDRYAIKYERTSGCRRGLYKVVDFTHEEASSDSVSFLKETQASAPGLPMDCSMECRALSESSFRSSTVNLQACAFIGGSSQEEG